ncbi:type II toxin-antitoxin system VapC family toxin [Spirosoma areae]
MIVDSNVIIYSIQPGYESIQDYLLERVDQVYASAITKLEVVGFHKLNDSEKQQFELFFATITTLPIDEAIIHEAIRLRQQRKRSLGDSIIAATGLLYNQPVLTNNAGDFSDIGGLQVIALADILHS